LHQPYGYTGREYDAESGLYHYRARAYDPRSSVFVQSDPIGFGSGTLAIYGYVDGNTFNYADPIGLISFADNTVNMGMSSASSAIPTWQVSSGLATMTGKLLQGVTTVTALVKIYDASTGYPNGQEPNNCDNKNSAAGKARARLRAAYKPLETMKRGCGGLKWSVASEAMERLIRARRGYKLVALRKLEMALCHDGGNHSHRGHVDQALETAKQCMSQ
jgi:RHS repeat-associated protein